MPHSVNFYLSGWSFPSFRWSPLVRVLIHIGDTCRYVYLSLYVALSSVPLSCELYPSPNPIFSTLPLQFKRQLRAAWVLLPALLSGKFLKAISSANSRAFLFACQHSGLMHLLSDVLCLEKLLFQLFYLFYDCFRSKVNSVPVISSFKDYF